MKIAYLILAHNTPNHLRRLVQSLASDTSKSFIHLDRKSENHGFFETREHNVCYTTSRVPVYWGDFSQVEAILILLNTAYSDTVQFDRFVLLSGSDFPLRSAVEIERFFEANAQKEFMNLVEMPSVKCGKPLSRLTTYRLRPGGGRIANTLRKACMKLGLIPRTRDHTKHLPNLIPYGGSTWWALSRDAVAYILQFVQDRPRVVNFFKNTLIPDEAFFQTILGNSPFKPRITGNLTYTDWTAGGSSPSIISEKHLKLFASPSFSADDSFGPREVLFARKFPDDSERLVSTLTSRMQ